MLDKSLSAPVSARGLFGGDSDSDGGFDNDGEETVVTVAGVELRVRQRPFHPLNVRRRNAALSCNAHALWSYQANAVWPGAHVLAEWLRSNADALRGKSILELGSVRAALRGVRAQPTDRSLQATGAVALVATALGLNITTSDVDDGEVEECIAANFVLNGVQPAAHIPHSWGDPLPHTLSFDVVIASDILLCAQL